MKAPESDGIKEGSEIGVSSCLSVWGQVSRRLPSIQKVVKERRTLDWVIHYRNGTCCVKKKQEKLGIVFKNKSRPPIHAWYPCLRDLPYEFYALTHEPGRVSDTALSLLDHLINRLPTNDRPRLRTFRSQLFKNIIALSLLQKLTHQVQSS